MRSTRQFGTCGAKSKRPTAGKDRIGGFHRCVSGLDGGGFAGARQA